MQPPDINEYNKNRLFNSSGNKSAKEPLSLARCSVILFILSLCICSSESIFTNPSFINSFLKIFTPPLLFKMLL